jgi:hypothetical protein
VQIIKKDPTYGSVLEFGTELVIASDHSIVALWSISHRESGLVRRADTATVLHINTLKQPGKNKEVGR